MGDSILETNNKQQSNQANDDDDDVRNEEELVGNKKSSPSLNAKLAESVVVLDIGNLMVFDPRPIDSIELKKNRETFLKDLCTQSTQFLVNKLFNLPVERVDDIYVAKLPKPITILPREKPLPKQKPLTKWEQYAKMKGIQKHKKSRMVFDEQSKEWKPRWGYNRANDTTKDWLIEIGKNQDPYEDHFAKRTTEKNERVAKNELKRLRNIARATKQKVPGVGLTPTEEKQSDKLQLKNALHMAKTADASMSKFSDKIKEEDKVTRGFGKKRKFESNIGDLKTEKDRQLKLFQKLTSNSGKSSKEKLNIDKAVNKHISNEDNDGENFRKDKKSKKRSDAGKHRRLGGKGKGKGKGRPRK